MADKDRSAGLDNVMDLEVPVAVVLERGRHHDDPLPILVNGARVASGKAVDIGERLGLRLETIDSVPAGRPNLS